MSNKRRRRNAEPEFFFYTPGVAVPRDVTHVLVPAGVEVLPDRAFEECRSLKEVVLSAGLQEIGKYAFGGCRSLACVNLPSTLVKIGYYAFYQCDSLRTLDFPEGLTEICIGAFYHCSSLVRLRLPSTVDTIAVRTFFGCHSLKEVTLLDGIREIRDTAFFGCHSLEDLILPATLTAIGTSAFQRCQLLRMVILREGVQMIEKDAFDECDLLDHIGTPSKALLAVFGDVGNYRFRLVTNGGIPRPDRPQVIITSESFNSISTVDLSEFQSGIAEILGLETEWAEKHRRLRALVAPHVLRHRKEVTTILELGLWKSRMIADGVNPDLREDCRLYCGAGVVIPCVLSFL